MCEYKFDIQIIDNDNKINNYTNSEHNDVEINYKYQYSSDIHLMIYNDEKECVFDSEKDFYLFDKNEYICESNHRQTYKKNNKYNVKLKNIIFSLETKNIDSEDNEQFSGTIKSIKFEMDYMLERKDDFPNYIGIIDINELTNKEIEILKTHKIVYKVYHEQLLNKLFFVNIFIDNNIIMIGRKFTIDQQNLSEIQLNKLKLFCEMLSIKNKHVDVDIYAGGGNYYYVDNPKKVFVYGWYNDDEHEMVYDIQYNIIDELIS